MRNANHVALAMIALVVTAPSVQAQHQPVEDQWYWGAEGGVMLFQTVDPNAGTIRASTQALTYGGHWLISKRRIGLHLGFDIVDFGAGTNSAIQVSPTTAATVSFSSMQRIQGGLLAMPMRGGLLHPYAGIGFAIQNVTDAVATLPATATQNEINVANETLPEFSSKAFAVLTGGLEFRMGRLSWFGTYQYMPAGQEFLLINAQHVFLAGLRFALSAASEEIGTEK